MAVKMPILSAIKKVPAQLPRSGPTEYVRINDKKRPTTAIIRTMKFRFFPPVHTTINSRNGEKTNAAKTFNG